MRAWVQEQKHPHVKLGLVACTLVIPELRGTWWLPSLAAGSVRDLISREIDTARHPMLSSGLSVFVRWGSYKETESKHQGLWLLSKNEGAHPTSCPSPSDLTKKEVHFTHSYWNSRTCHSVWFLVGGFWMVELWGSQRVVLNSFGGFLGSWTINPFVEKHPNNKTSP